MNTDKHMGHRARTDDKSPQRGSHEGQSHILLDQKAGYTYAVEPRDAKNSISKQVASKEVYIYVLERVLVNTTHPSGLRTQRKWDEYRY